MASLVGVSQTRPYADVKYYIHKAITGNSPVHILPPYRPESNTKLAGWLNASLDDVAVFRYNWLKRL